MILIVDNYDSFTYNLYQYVGQYTTEVEVVRNDRATVEEVDARNPSGILISPGPGRPDDAGISMAVIRDLSHRIPVFGVCLGHQSIGQVFGGKIVGAPTIMHGKVSMIEHDGKGIFDGIPDPFSATRYHSLVIDPDTFPHDELEISAKTADGVIMGVRHKSRPFLEGVQFHPESILTEYGMRMIENFIRHCRKG